MDGGCDLAEADFARHGQGEFRDHGAKTTSIPWPHLGDRAAAAGVQYGVQPMAFAVHAEYINRPRGAIIDMDGVLRFLYQGNFRGDRPSVQQLLDMVKSGNYEFDAPKRLIPKKP